MRSNGERIYQGLMGREPMEELEKENVPPKEKGIPWENARSSLIPFLDALLAEEKSVPSAKKEGGA